VSPDRNGTANHLLLLFVSFLPFTTAIVATHLFTTVLPLSHDTVLRPGTPAERVAVVLFGLNLTLAAGPASGP